MSYFGNEWEIQISTKKAKHLLGDFPLPRMGHITDIKIKKCDYGFYHRLSVMNISGTYFVASSSIPHREWLSFFEFCL
jgi:hypothetical protein